MDILFNLSLSHTHTHSLSLTPLTFDVTSSNLMEYPTSSPSFTPISSETLLATDKAVL